jgi:hypothetical protein
MENNQEQKLYKVTEVAKLTGLSPEYIREICHARGQRFAYKLKKGGIWYISLPKLLEWLEKRQEQTRKEEVYYA